MKTIQSNIMRRVYLSYALSFTEQPLLWVGFMLGGSVALIGRLTHVASIIDNTLATPLGQVPAYLVNAFVASLARGELGTVLLVLTIASLSAVAAWRLAHIQLWYLLPKPQQVG